ncbi:MAG: AraC family transcriptional regulator [Streptococcaceae bacterium]|nr:AraC family transcriptional regulator [Streptococcaceae bacterium]
MTNHHETCPINSKKQQHVFVICNCQHLKVHQRQIESVLVHIENNLDYFFTPKDIANLIGYSQGHFHRIFKLNLGMTYMEYGRKKE